jgi:hypothetical protein
MRARPIQTELHCFSSWGIPRAQMQIFIVKTRRSTTNKSQLSPRNQVPTFRLAGMGEND